MKWRLHFPAFRESLVHILKRNWVAEDDFVSHSAGIVFEETGEG